MVPIILKKMHVEDHNPVTYTLVGDNHSIVVNHLIGREISLNLTDEIICQGCGKSTKKSFAQGYCYPCFLNSPETEACVLKPEACKAQWGQARDIEWARENHLKPHFVYLAYTGDVKVGVTRKSQIPVRWIDQGAISAVAMLEVPNRHIAGTIEVFMKQFFSDRTNWIDMLSTQRLNGAISLAIEKFRDVLPEEFKNYLIKTPGIKTFNYPLDLNANYGFKTVDLLKYPIIRKVLVGIKGQYLVFNDHKVVNIRKYTGYVAIFNYS